MNCHINKNIIGAWICVSWLACFHDSLSESLLINYPFRTPLIEIFLNNYYHKPCHLQMYRVMWDFKNVFSEVKAQSTTSSWTNNKNTAVSAFFTNILIYLKPRFDQQWRGSCCTRSACVKMCVCRSRMRSLHLTIVIVILRRFFSPNILSVEWPA